MVKRSESLKEFLGNKARPELAALYKHGMEVQVNVAADNGTSIQLSGGTRTRVWTDGTQSWTSFRMPKGASSNPVDNDMAMDFSLVDHAEGVGLTGWNYKERVSEWVGFDFDAMVGHSERHTRKLTPEELDSVKKACLNLPWVQVRRSTSGSGLHLYVRLAMNEHNVVNNSREHRAISRYVLAKMSALTGYSFTASVDVQGSVLWIWHRKFEACGGLDGPGLTLEQDSTSLFDLDESWRHQIDMINQKSTRVKLPFLDGLTEDEIERIETDVLYVKLGPMHKKVLACLESMKALWWYDAERNMVICHTADLKVVHERLKLPGVFSTLSTGSEEGDQNCFMYPLPEGAWVVRRHSKGVEEASTWDLDPSGWRRCYYGQSLTLRQASLSTGGSLTEGGFYFETHEGAAQCLERLQVSFTFPSLLSRRPVRIKETKDNTLRIEVERYTEDPITLAGWQKISSKRWGCYLETPGKLTKAEEANSLDHVVRHLVSTGGEDRGWRIRTGASGWTWEPFQNVNAFLKGELGGEDVNLILSGAIRNPWVEVSIPFQPEFPGARRWNIGAAQFTCKPNLSGENLVFPSWEKVLRHIGSGLNMAISEDPWCRLHNIRHGIDYLMLWFASLVQYPDQPLPYLFLYSPEEGTGKSILYEGWELLINPGVCRAAQALGSEGGFNGELKGMVLCVIEEASFAGKADRVASRLRDWVTSTSMLIHEKGRTPYQTPNYSHWLHCANLADAAPILPGDTRITMIQVPVLNEAEEVPKSQLLTSLRAEGPDFLGHLLTLEIPPHHGRLKIPVIETVVKAQSKQMQESLVSTFIRECCFKTPGEMIVASEFYAKFWEWSSTTNDSWPRPTIGKEIKKLGFPIGLKSNKTCYGNLTFNPEAAPGVELVEHKGSLQPKRTIE